MNKTPLLATAPRPTPPTSRMCRLDLRAVPTARRPAKRGFTRAAMLRLGATIVAIELVIAGGLRLGVGAPEDRPVAAEVVQVAPRVAALPLSALDAPPAHPAAALRIRQDAARIADAAPTVHLQGGPTGFGTF